MPYTPEEITQAGKTVGAVRVKARATLLPIQHEMQIMGWGQELRAAMWEAILRMALDRMVEALSSGGPVSGQEPDGAGRDASNDSGLQRSRPVDQR